MAMTERMLDPKPLQVCPTCGEQLRRDGDVLRCDKHGAFFLYGPRLLVAVANRNTTQAPLMPWQTMSDK
jgi:hypothetical protein